MKDLREIIAKNICALRSDANMTQLDLAELLNYSDKAVSKWERGEAIPDVIVLKRIADHFGVTVDYLLEEKHPISVANQMAVRKLRHRNHFVISLVAFLLVWFVATISYAALALFADFPAWLSYIYAIPLSFIVVLVFNSIWGKPRLNILPVTPILWGVALSVYLTLRLSAGVNFWMIFIIAAPLQLMLMFIPGVSFFRYSMPKERGGDE